jgi:flavorubredoxin
MIAPSHGIVWRDYIAEILKKYEQWGAGYTTDKVIIAYDSMWGATEKMARQILDGVAAAGVPAKLYKLAITERSEISKELLEARGLIIGSSTLNNGMLPTMGAFLIYLKGLRPANKLTATFGAFGWAGGAQTAMEELVKQAGMQIAQPSLSIKWTPDQTEVEQCFQFGLDFANKVQGG